MGFRYRVLYKRQYNWQPLCSAQWLAVAAGVFEVIYRLSQAARPLVPHYNNFTTIEEIMFGLMGVGALMLIIVSFYLGWLLYRDYRQEKNDVFKLASAYGLMIGSVLTLIAAATMSSGTKQPNLHAGLTKRLNQLQRKTRLIHSTGLD